MSDVPSTTDVPRPSDASTGQLLLDPTGSVRWVPSAERKAAAAATGRSILSRGALCTACLVDTWALSLLKSRKSLCDWCERLESEVSRRAGLERSTAGRPRPSESRFRLVEGGEPGIAPAPAEDPDDPLVRARADRAAQLARVFVHARAAGVVLLQERAPGVPPAELVELHELHASGVLPADPAARIRRYAAWLERLDPAEHAERAEVLGDVEGLTRWSVETEEALHRHRVLGSVQETRERVEAAERALVQLRIEAARAAAEASALG